MKSLICVLTAIILLSMSASAADSPIDKGSVIAEGTLGFATYNGSMYENRKNGHLTEVTIAPSLGYFFTSGLMAGIQLNCGSISQAGSSTLTFGVGPSLTYFFDLNSSRTKVKGAIYPYIGAFYLFSSFEQDDYRITSYGPRLGALLMISNSVAVDFGLRGTHNKVEWLVTSYYYPYDYYNQSSRSSTGNAIQLTVGFSAFIY